MNKFILLCLILTGCLSETYRERQLDSEYTISNRLVAKSGNVSDYALCDGPSFIKGGCWAYDVDPNFQITTSEPTFNQYGRVEGWFCEGTSNNINDNHSVVVAYATCLPE